MDDPNPMDDPALVENTTPLSDPASVDNPAPGDKTAPMEDPPPTDKHAPMDRIIRQVKKCIHQNISKATVGIAPIGSLSHADSPAPEENPALMNSLAPVDSPAHEDNSAPMDRPARRNQDTLETFKMKRNRPTAFRNIRSLDHHGLPKVITALLLKF
jgi:hypothetical protein